MGKKLFNYVIGNPPYQEQVSDADKNSSLSKQLFPIFIRESTGLAEKVMLITPSRWFTGRIKCAECGNNYRMMTRTRSTGEKYHIFGCATTNTCDNNSIHEDDLQLLSCEALGIQEFDSGIFSDKIDHVTIVKGGHVVFHFNDGTIHEAAYSTKRKMPKWSDERRETQSKAIRDSFTEERRQKMSDAMKKIRSEKFWNSKGR